MMIEGEVEEEKKVKMSQSPRKRGRRAAKKTRKAFKVEVCDKAETKNDNQGF